MRERFLLPYLSRYKFAKFVIVKDNRQVKRPLESQRLYIIFAVNIRLQIYDILFVKKKKIKFFFLK